ncbi:MAG: GTP-binding protein [Acidobacteria bacterium]|nr:MAG: GTP-binding protein [Acidobacteriota bacterium]
MTKTPIALITGSLGSGKTTLLRRILETTDRRLAVLMNEFGEIAIDSQIIQGENVQIVELAGGCVCCSLTGEFEAAVTEIIDTVHPEFIVVEATGVAEADALVYEVEDNLPQVRLDSVICIVDAYASIKYPAVGYTARTQLEAADAILINKIDLVTPEQVKDVEAQVRAFNDRALIFRTVRCDVDIEVLLGLDIGRRPKLSPRQAATDWQSFTFTSEKLLDRDKFEDAIAELPTTIYRAKGFVRFPEGSYLLNYVAGRWELEEFAAQKTELVFIGQSVSDDQQTILHRLRACEL